MNNWSRRAPLFLCRHFTVNFWRLRVAHSLWTFTLLGTFDCGEFHSMYKPLHYCEDLMEANFTSSMATQYCEDWMAGGGGGHSLYGYTLLWTFNPVGFDSLCAVSSWTLFSCPMYNSFFLLLTTALLWHHQRDPSFS